MEKQVENEEVELYALNFSGRFPTVRYYPSRAAGVKARSRYRGMGYHVQLDKVQVRDAEAGLQRPEDEGGSDNTILTKIADRFRRKAR